MEYRNGRYKCIKSARNVARKCDETMNDCRVWFELGSVRDKAELPCKTTVFHSAIERISKQNIGRKFA
ncbi:MAG: hypothetical protein E6Q34_08320 [Burkholderiaceae bacterium]|nr:MAG: hypothetical protein E6Q34_08320 [Burkholderiaceae bacterium]